MEGVWKINPFYWVALRRFSRKQRKQSLTFQQTPRQCSRRQQNLRRKFENLNPFRWSRRAIRVFGVGFFTIMVPIYAYLGMQPAVSLEFIDAGYPNLQIESIGLETPVAPLTLQDRQLIAPNSIAGAYSSNENKTLLIGHSSTVFKQLFKIEMSDQISYDNVTYQVTDITIQEKSSISMNEILAPADVPTLILMTCAGEPLPNQDATHRLIVTATAMD